MLTIQYEARDSKKKAESLRRDGGIPAVFYGPKEESTSISIKAGDFKKVWKEAGESSIVVLKGPKGEEHEVLIKEVSVHPVSGVAQHADFYAIEKGKKLQVNVHLEYVGVSPAVKDLGGILVKVLHEVEIEAMPKDLPHDIQVDISSLTDLNSQILVSQLPVPAGVEILTGAEEVVAAIDVAKEEDLDAPAPTLEDIEVVNAKGKEEPAPGEATAE